MLLRWDIGFPLYYLDMVQSTLEQEELVPYDLSVMRMMESRDLGGDRHCPLQIHVSDLMGGFRAHPLIAL